LHRMSLRGPPQRAGHRPWNSEGTATIDTDDASTARVLAGAPDPVWSPA
jgi:hypothetical protein